MVARRRSTKQKQPRSKPVSAVLVVGTGLGGDIEGSTGPTEFGKFGLNAGTNLRTGDFPQVPPRDFVAASSVRANFSRLAAHCLGQVEVREIAALAKVDSNDEAGALAIRTKVMRTVQECAAHSLTAMGRVLADTCLLLLDPDLHPNLGVTRLYLGGGVAQHKTRTFLTRVMRERGKRLGLVIRPNNGSFELRLAAPLEQFRDWLRSQIKEDQGSAKFLAAAIERSHEFFSVCDEHYQALRSYLPYFAVDEILRELARRSGDLAAVRVVSGNRKLFTSLMPTGAGFDPEDMAAVRCLETVACSMFCKLLTKAMLEGYRHDSNFEGEAAIRRTLAIAGVQTWIQDLYVRVYRAHGFATLIESYRRTVVSMQTKSPPIGLATFQNWRFPSDSDAGLVLGLDIGAENVKATTWKVCAGQLQRVLLAEPFETPLLSEADVVGEPPLQAFFQKVIGKAATLVDLKRVAFVGISWPGPVTDSGPAQFSGIFRRVPGLPRQVLGTLPEHLDSLDIKQAFGRAWEETFPTADIQITLINDGTAFAAYYLHQNLVRSARQLTVRYHGTAGAALLAVAPVTGGRRRQAR